MPTDAEINEKEQRIRLDLAYKEVLGYEGKETMSQRLVRLDMERMIRNQSFREDDQFNTHGAAMRDGYRKAFKYMRDKADGDPYEEHNQPRQAIGAKTQGGNRL